MKIAFDVGGVLTKYPETFIEMMRLLQAGGAQVFVVSDMKPELLHNIVVMNNLPVSPENIYSVSFVKDGECCKATLCEKLGIDVLIDDHIGYLAAGKHVRLLVMPEPTIDYYSKNWKTDGSEGEFGRSKASKI